MNYIKINPVVGMPVTVLVGTDMYASAIAKIEHDSMVITLVDGRKAAPRHDGRYFIKEAGCTLRVVLGVAEDYRDPSF